MTNCEAEPRSASFLPDFARNNHGNLREQNRTVGAQRGADTTRPPGWLAAPAAPGHRWRPEGQPAAPRPRVAKAACTACHGVDAKLVGRACASPEVCRQADYLVGKIPAAARRLGPDPMPPQTLPKPMPGPSPWLAGRGQMTGAALTRIAAPRLGTSRSRKKDLIPNRSPRRNPRACWSSAPSPLAWPGLGLCPAHWSGKGRVRCLRLNDALMKARNTAESKDLSVTHHRPDIAENGAVVPVAVASLRCRRQAPGAAGREEPAMLVAVFDVTDAVEPTSPRVKMGQSSERDLAVAVTADNKAHYAQKEVKVTLGGCGG